jgi:hypothetical protein
MVSLTLPSYRFRATSMIFCRCLYTLWRCSYSQDFDFYKIFSK